jgi:phenylacetate-CoA ligase
MRRTSGSTESQLSFRTCYIAQMAEGCMMHRLYRWHGLDGAAAMASIRYYGAGNRQYPQGQTDEQWSYPGPKAEHHTLNLDCTTGEMIEWLLRKRPRYLTTPPSIAQEIALHPDADKLNDIGISAVCGVSEIATRFARSAVRERFGCDVLEMYAAGEVGAIAIQSPVNHSFLVCEETALVEILDESGRRVAPGEIGRVVVTGLYNYATPFIRYETGDYARLASRPCPSGRSLKRLERIEGRKRNALVARNGTRVWLHDVLAGEAIKRVGASLFQIVQVDRATIEFRYTPQAGPRRPDRDELTVYFSSLLDQPVDVRLSELPAAPRSTGRKHEAVVTTIA